MLCLLFALGVFCTACSDGASESAAPTPVTPAVAEPTPSKPPVAPVVPPPPPVPQPVPPPVVPPVVEQLRIERFVATDATGKEITAVLAPGTVTLAWTVQPADAQVTIDGGIGDVTALTKDGKGTKDVEIKATTTFALTATKEGAEPAHKTLTMTLQPPNVLSAALVATPRTAIFSGEPVTLKVKVALSTGGSFPEAGNVKIFGPGDTVVAEGATEKTITPTASGLYYAVVGDVTTKPIAVMVRHWHAVRDGVGTTVDVHPHAVWMGYETALPDNHLVLAMQELGGLGAHTPSVVAIPYVEQFESVTTDYNDDPASPSNPFRQIGQFVVNRIAANPSDPQQVVVGTSGALFLSRDGGQTFAIVDAIRRRQRGDGTHVSCKGLVQKGRVGEVDNAFAGVDQICDIAFLPSGWVVIAYDEGVAYTTDLVGHMQDPQNDAHGWQGVRRDGAGGNALAGVVNHALAADVNNGALYVASDLGVYRSTDDAATFTDVGALKEAAYAIMVAADGTLYAGTKDRIVRFEKNKWTTVASLNASVMGLVADPADATLYVAAADGLHVLRNGKETTVLRQAFGGAVDMPVIVRAVAAAPGQGGADLYVATSRGIFVSRALVPQSSP